MTDNKRIIQMASMHWLCITPTNDEHIVELNIGEGPVRLAKDQVLNFLTAANMRGLANKIDVGGEVDELLTPEQFEILSQKFGGSRAQR